jgi:hypothetical protein
MSVLRVDDRGTGADIILVADVPSRDVDQMEIAETTRRVRHAGESEIGAIDAQPITRKVAPAVKDFTNRRCKHRGVVDEVEKAKNRTARAEALRRRNGRTAIQ